MTHYVKFQLYYYEACVCGSGNLKEPVFSDYLTLLTIPPGGTESFSVGWFFQNARGRWENDTEAWMVFLEKGTYKIRIIFRNVFPKAAVYNTSADKHESVSVWTGEMLSREIAVEIK